jgi:hypothetical protein
MKKIEDIYKDYKIMPNLALHQYRVSAVAIQICDSLDVEINKENIVKACIFHDMGNIIKFNLNHFPEWNNPEGTEYWQSVKSDYISKYGNNEHKASLQIAKELGLSSDILGLIDCVDSSSVEIIRIEDDFAKKICIYSDNRVTPHGVVSAEDHSLEAKERYKDHPHAFDEESRQFFNKNLNLIEEQIFSHSNIKPEDINDSSIEKYLGELQDFSI